MRITTAWVDIVSWRAEGVVRRYLHWAKQVELLRRCSALRRDIASLRTQFHELLLPRSQDGGSSNLRNRRAPTANSYFFLLNRYLVDNGRISQLVWESDEFGPRDRREWAVKASSTFSTLEECIYH